jgi:hypothetical protein
VRAPFDLSAPLARGRVVIEASAGTGKTYALTNLAVRHLVETELAPEQLLMVTYTRAAANELRERARVALARAIEVLATGVVPVDHPWMSVLTAGTTRESTSDSHGRGGARTFRRRDDHHDPRFLPASARPARTPLRIGSGGSPRRELGRPRHGGVPGRADRRARRRPRRSRPVRDRATARRHDRWSGRSSLRVKAVMSNPSAELVPRRGVDDAGDRWVDAVERAVAEVRHRQRQRREIGFDRW